MVITMVCFHLDPGTGTPKTNNMQMLVLPLSALSQVCMFPPQIPLVAFHETEQDIQWPIQDLEKICGRSHLRTLHAF